ncbi:MAG: hypothetical protein VYC34_02025, partial [Planctomycetota bacterium]|nr:hypothetical protein [Planctomycetota bacterium]
MQTTFVLTSFVAASLFTQAQQSAHAESQDHPMIVRVQSPTNADDVVSREGPEGPLYSAGPVATDTKLPVGYPRPTPPGAMEIKRYDVVRQAEVSGEGAPDRSRG